LVRVDAPESVLAGALSTAFHAVLAKQLEKKSAVNNSSGSRKKKS